MKVKSYTFGDASSVVIDNIDTIVGETIEFLEAMLSKVLTPISTGIFVESSETSNIITYLSDLRLITFDEIETQSINGKTTTEKKYRFVSTMYKEKVQNADNIGETYIALITQYITLLKSLVPYYSNLTVGDLDSDNDSHKDITSMKKQINTKLVQMTNYIKFFHFDSYIVDYSRYVYMIYAIQMFKDLDDIYDILKVKSDLATLDSNIQLNSLESMGSEMDREIGNLTKLMRDDANTRIEITDMDDIPTTQLPKSPKPPTPPPSQNPPLQPGQQGFVNSQRLNFQGQQGGNTVQITINRLKVAFEAREKEFKEDREALIVFFNTANDIIRKASDEIKEVYFRKYENILTDKRIVDTLNNLSMKISNNNNDKLGQVFTGDVSQAEMADLEVIISSATNGKKVKAKDLKTLVKLDNKIRGLNKQTTSFLNPVTQ